MSFYILNGQEFKGKGSFLLVWKWSRIFGHFDANGMCGAVLSIILPLMQRLQGSFVHFEANVNILMQGGVLCAEEDLRSNITYCSNTSTASPHPSNPSEPCHLSLMQVQLHCYSQHCYSLTVQKLIAMDSKALQRYILIKWECIAMVPIGSTAMVHFLTKWECATHPLLNLHFPHSLMFGLLDSRHL